MICLIIINWYNNNYQKFKTFHSNIRPSPERPILDVEKRHWMLTWGKSTWKIRANISELFWDFGLGAILQWFVSSRPRLISLFIQGWINQKHLAKLMKNLWPEIRAIYWPKIFSISWFKSNTRYEVEVKIKRLTKLSGSFCGKSKPNSGKKNVRINNPTKVRIRKKSPKTINSFV